MVHLIHHAPKWPDQNTHLVFDLILHGNLYEVPYWSWFIFSVNNSNCAIPYEEKTYPRKLRRRTLIKIIGIFLSRSLWIAFSLTPLDDRYRNSILYPSLSAKPEIIILTDIFRTLNILRTIFLSIEHWHRDNISIIILNHASPDYL